MLQDFLEKFCEEFAVTLPKKNPEKVYLFKFVGESLVLKDLDPGLSMQAQICEVPKKKTEELFIYLMRANLLGQGTGQSRIGIDFNEKFLTLSLGLPYEFHYQMFKETVEEFINYLIYWREDVARFESEESVY